jgi:hypothetical protein
MKRILSIFSFAAVLAVSCNTAPQPNAVAGAISPATDTSGLAQFQQWKAMNELANMQQFQNMNAAAQPATKTIVRYVPVRSSSRSSSSRVYSSNSSSSNTATASRKKGWSKSAKGAVIGGVAGAAGGAIINKKNRALGAVIGGVLGAGAGYGIGRGMDKRDGRF